MQLCNTNVGFSAIWCCGIALHGRTVAGQGVSINLFRLSTPTHEISCLEASKRMQNLYFARVAYGFKKLHSKLRREITYVCYRAFVVFMLNVSFLLAKCTFLYMCGVTIVVFLFAGNCAKGHA